jgi:hypothetical protein
MPKKRYTAEEIIHKLRGAYVLLGSQSWNLSSITQRWTKRPMKWKLNTTPQKGAAP